LRLIEEMNPGWVDLWPELMGHDLLGPLLICKEDDIP